MKGCKCAERIEIKVNKFQKNGGVALLAIAVLAGGLTVSTAPAEAFTPPRSAWQPPRMELPQWQWPTPAKPMGSLQDLSIPGLPKPPRPKPTRPANKPPVNRVITGVNSRTTIAIIHYNGATSLTPNAREARPGLSIVKMYMADYVLRYRKPTSRDRVLLERMIRLSDDGAASEINRKYPGAINAIAREYGLTSTKGQPHWGNSTSSAYDAAKFLHRLRKNHPGSSVLRWMQQAAPVAADGTRQNWGTSHLPRVQGTKWGWSDYGRKNVASASFGDNYTAAAFTWGHGGVQTGDVAVARNYLR